MVIFPELSVIKSENIATTLRLGDSVMLLGSDKENGLFWWNLKDKTVLHLTTGKGPGALGDNTINSISLSADRKQVIVCGDKNISVINIGNRQTKIVNLQNHRYFFDIKNIQGKYYLASYENGLLTTDTSFKVLQKITTEQGLTDNGVY